MNRWKVCWYINVNLSWNLSWNGRHNHNESFQAPRSVKQHQQQRQLQTHPAFNQSWTQLKPTISMASASSSSGLSGTCFRESSCWPSRWSSRSAGGGMGRSPNGGRLTTCRLFRDLYTPLWLLPATLFFSAMSYSQRSERNQQNA